MGILPMHFIGLAGLPRRYYSNTAFPMFDDVADTNVIITMFAIIGGVAQLIFLANFLSLYTEEQKQIESMEVKYHRMDYASRTIASELARKILYRWAYDYSKK